MSEQSSPAPFHTLIHIGCGATPNLTVYGQLAEHGCLIDADPDVINRLEAALAAHPTLRCQQALVDTQEQTGTFYRYSNPWANGLTPIDKATQRLYPGLRYLDSTQQHTTPVHTLVAQCLPPKEAESEGTHILLLEAGQQNEALLNALEETGQLSRFTTVIVLPVHRRVLPIAVPLSLHGPAEAPAELTLPENSQVLKRHPLLEQKQRYQQAAEQYESAHQQATQKLGEYETLLTENEQQLRQAADALRDTQAQREKHQQDLAQTQHQLAESDKQLAERTQQREEKAKQLENTAKACDELKHQLEQRTQERDQLTQQRVEAQHAANQQAEQHAQALKAEQEKIAQLAKERDQVQKQAEQLQQALDEKAQQLAERDQQRAERTQQRDDEWQKGEQLVKERDELRHELEEAQKQQEEALHQKHQNFQAKTDAETRVTHLEKELETAMQQAKQSRQQFHLEQNQRQQLVEQEMLKAEAQLDLIKDILIQGKEF
jgi:hypothetical protein